jgi:hypothetical protein
MGKELDISVHIGHAMGGRDSESVRIEFEDKTSGIQFMEIRMGLEQFGALIASRGSVDLKATVRGLEYVGMKCVRENRTAHAPNLGYPSARNEYAQWLLANCAEEGWTLSTYLGSQGSIGFADKETGLVRLSYYVFKYVPAE